MSYKIIAKKQFFDGIKEFKVGDREYRVSKEFGCYHIYQDTGDAFMHCYRMACGKYSYMTALVKYLDEELYSYSDDNEDEDY